MKRIVFFAVTIFVLGSLFFFSPGDARAAECTIQNPTSVIFGQSFVVQLTGSGLDKNAVWQLQAYGEKHSPSQVDIKKGSLPLPFTITNGLSPDKYSFLASGSDGTNLSACGSTNDTEIKPNPAAPGLAGQNLCWSINVGDHKCFDTCPKLPGQFATYDACNAESQKQQAQLLPPSPNPILLPVPLPQCAQWAGWNGTQYVPISKDRIGEYFKNGQLKPNTNVRCIAVDTAIGEISTEPQKFVQDIFGIVLGIAGGIALILIIISGYKFMASQGNPEALKAAQEQLISAIIGLLFIIFSFVILQVIGVDILKIPGFQPLD